MARIPHHQHNFITARKAKRPNHPNRQRKQAGDKYLPIIPPEAIQQQINTIYLDTATYALSFICFCFLLRIIQRTNQAQNALATQQGSLKP